MGWLFSSGTRSELIASLIRTQDTDRFHCETLKHTLRGNVLWSVARFTAKQDNHALAAGQSTLMIRCDLLRRSAGEWGCKSLSEDDGPYYYSCPLSYLAMVPVRSPGWREQVMAYHQSRRKGV